VILAKTITGAFTDRYAMSAVIGIGILLAWGIFVIGHQSSHVALVIAAALVALFGLDTVRDYRQLLAGVEDRLMTYRFLRFQKTGGLPVVLAGPHLFLELSYDPAQRHENANFVYLADATLASRYTDTDDVERGLLALRRWAPLNVQDFHMFCASHRNFLVYGYYEPFSWVIQEFLKERRPLIVKAENGGRLLFLVSSENDH
jgi:hypothetical protein